MPYVFTARPYDNLFSEFYDELQGYLDAIVAGVIPDTSITNAKLATDIKIGSLATLTTTEKSSVVGAINEIDAKFDTALISDATITSVRAKKIQLNGLAYTPLAFKTSTAASVTGTITTATLDLTGVGDGGTIIFNPNSLGADTATVNFAAGTSLSGGTPSTDISTGVDKSFMISADGDTAELVTLTLAGLNSGAAIAAEMQTKIRALGGRKAAITVSYNAGANGKYLITSTRLGTGSSIVITEAPLNSVTEELKIGTAAGGTETAGTGDVADAAAATHAEIAAVINGDIAGVTAVGTTGSLVITSTNTGATSSIVMGNGTLNTVLGLTNEAEYYGMVGMGYSTDMADANYFAVATLNGTTTLTSLNLSITNRSTTGFHVRCETAASTQYVDVIIMGVAV
jgi:hypothetical protein